MADLIARSVIRELVRERYAAAATSIAEGAPAVDPMVDPTDSACWGPATAAGSSCCARVSPEDADGNEVFGGSLDDAVGGAADAAVQASLGCGVPTSATARSTSASRRRSWWRVRGCLARPSALSLPARCGDQL